MKRAPMLKLLERVILFAAVTAMLAPSDLRAERVGFSFQGALIGGTGTYSLFGISVPKTSPVVGTFSLDTTTPGVDAEPGVRTFHQLIQGGYTLNINSGAIRLAASDYMIIVADDFERTPEPVDIFSVDFDNAFAPAPSPIFVNGAAWGGVGAVLKVELSWPAATFTDPDEPKLTTDRALTPDPGVSALVGSSTISINVIPRFFSVTSITAIDPQPGDYNFDDAIDWYDLAEWRRAFGATDLEFLHADGNDDGMVDAADYIVWRKALNSGGGLGASSTTVPEPSGLLPLGMALMMTRVLRKNGGA